MIEQPFEIDSRPNRISGIMIIPRSRKRFPCAVLSHGLVSSKESSKYITLSERLSEAGIASCRFDYHGCGESGGNIEETTLTIRLDNLSAIVDHVLSHPSVDPARIGIIGSSFGGSRHFSKRPVTNGSGACPSGPPHLLENKDEHHLRHRLQGNDIHGFPVIRRTGRGQEGVPGPRHSRRGRRGRPLR